MSRSAFRLSIHADWACRHAGACCEAGWPIPVEEGSPLGLRVLPTDGEGRCVYRDREAKRCRVHRDLGEAALPAACRHFPRVCLLDGRGVHVTLSCFCPTAEALLDRDDVPLRVVEGAWPLPDGSEPEGLDAREALPPMLTPKVLFDLPGYSAWERRMIAVLDGSSTPEEGLSRIREEARELSSWRPGGASIEETIGRWSEVPPVVSASRPVRAWLAARAFACWEAYRGEGVLDVVSWLDRCRSTLREEGTFSGADHRLLHRT